MLPFYFYCCSTTCCGNHSEHAHCHVLAQLSVKTLILKYSHRIPQCRLHFWRSLCRWDFTRPTLFSSRLLGTPDPRSSGAPVRPHGNPFLSRPQTAGGSSGGAQLSKPFPKPQLKSPTLAHYQGWSSFWMHQTCASPTVHTDRAAKRNSCEKIWKWENGDGLLAVALKQPSWCIMTRSGWAIELLVRTAIHTHTLNVQQTCAHTHTHTFKTASPLRVGAITRGNPTHWTVPKSHNLDHSSRPLRVVKINECFLVYHVYVQDGCGCNVRVLFSLLSRLHPMSPEWVIVHLSFVPLIYPLSCRGDFVSPENPKHLHTYVERVSYLRRQYLI